MRAEVNGPAGSSPARLALDIAATYTSINPTVLIAAGYNPTIVPPSVHVTTGSGTLFVPRITVMKFKALGQDRPNFPILSYALPPTALVDGVLGLDFFRGTILTLDFRIGQITLA